MLTTAGVTAVVLIGALLLAGAGSDRGAQAEPDDGSATPSTTGGGMKPRADLGPEDVPMPGGVLLGPAGSPKRGSSLGGIPCGSAEQLTYHVHARLTLFVNGKPRSIPMVVGIGKPRKVTDSGMGAFVSGGS